MPYCPECGGEYIEGIKFCPECGKRLLSGKLPETVASPKTRSSEPAHKRFISEVKKWESDDAERDKRVEILFWVFIAAVLIWPIYYTFVCISYFFKEKPLTFTVANELIGMTINHILSPMVNLLFISLVVCLLITLWRKRFMRWLKWLSVVFTIVTAIALIPAIARWIQVDFYTPSEYVFTVLSVCNFVLGISAGIIFYLKSKNIEQAYFGDEVNSE